MLNVINIIFKFARCEFESFIGKKQIRFSQPLIYKRRYPSFVIRHLAFAETQHFSISLETSNRK